MCIHVQFLPAYIVIGNHTYAAVRGGEDHDFLVKSFPVVCQKVKDVMKNPTVSINGQHHNLTMGRTTRC